MTAVALQDGNMKKALELAGAAVSQPGGDDWWWQEQLGKAYYQLGLLRDADKHFAAAAELQVRVLTVRVGCCSTGGGRQIRGAAGYGSDDVVQVWGW